MSVIIAKTDGVTVLTLTADPQSSCCTVLCQIFKGLCCSPVWCSLSQHLRRVQRNSQSVLGALHIMVGVLNIGLGLILYSSPVSSFEMFLMGFPFWLASLFILFGVMNILSEKLPSPCLVTINVILNLVGVSFAITAIGLYSINLGKTWRRGRDWGWRSECGNNDYYSRSRYNMPKPTSPQEDFLWKKCMESKALAMMILRSINIVLIVLSVLELCVAISSVVMGIKALCSNDKRDNKNNNDPEHHQPLQEEVTSRSIA